MTTSNTPSAPMPEADVSAIIDEAVEALWESVKQRHPEHLCFGIGQAEGELRAAAGAAIKEWLLFNTASRCSRCGGEVWMARRDSYFGRGECRACERVRYESQQPLLDAAARVLDRRSEGSLTDALRDLDAAVARCRLPANTD